MDWGENLILDGYKVDDGVYMGRQSELSLC